MEWLMGQRLWSWLTVHFSFIRFMNHEPSTILRPWPRDRWFYLALAAGPLACAAGWFAGLGQSSSSERVLSLWFLKVSVLLPVCEEVFFRGIVQGRLAAAGWRRCSWIGITQANAAASALFALAHLVYHSPLHAVSVFFPSLVFGYFYDRHHHLLPPVLLHVAYNAAYFFLKNG